MQQIDHSQNIIEFKNLSFSYNGDFAVKNINFSIHKGDYLGIVGPNGAGKSTLLKLMLGLYKPVSGQILLFGKDIGKFNDWPKIGYVSQKAANIDPNFPATVEEVVSMGRYPVLSLFKYPAKEDREKVKKALEEVEMWDCKNRMVGDLSGGQQQRVFIARALASEPQVIVLDEPTTGIDVKTQRRFYQLLQKLNKKLGITLIIASHELDVLVYEASEIAYINCTLIYHGFPKNFIKSKYFNSLRGVGPHV